MTGHFQHHKPRKILLRLNRQVALKRPSIVVIEIRKVFSPENMARLKRLEREYKKDAGRKIPHDSLTERFAQTLNK